MQSAMSSQSACFSHEASSRAGFASVLARGHDARGHAQSQRRSNTNSATVFVPGRVSVHRRHRHRQRSLSSTKAATKVRLERRPLIRRLFVCLPRGTELQSVVMQALCSGANTIQAIVALAVASSTSLHCSPGNAWPNPSVKASPNGMPPGPGRRYAVHFRQPGPGVMPSAPPYLER
jgi:hypothetical protein